MYTALANRRFKFPKRGQLFVGIHNETLSVAAMRVSDPDRSPATRINAAAAHMMQWIRVYDAVGTVIETREHKSDFKEW